jgi:predicted lactoylglutathione lyase
MGNWDGRPSGLVSGARHRAAERRRGFRLVDRAVGAGARPVTEPAEHDWGYTALIADPDEHLWTLFAADSVRR